MLNAAAHRHHVADAPVIRILRRQDVIEQRALLIVGIPDIRLHGKQRTRHFDHVIDVAGLGGASVHHVRQLVRLSEVFVPRVAAGGEGVVLRHLVPEVLCRRAFGFVPGVQVHLQCPIKLRDLGVPVDSGKNVLHLGQPVDDRHVMELAGERQPAPVARIRVEIGQHLVHSAELRGQHPLDLLIAERRQNAFRPRRKLDLDIQSRAVSRVAISVAETREDLMLDVPRRPHAVQVEAAGADDAFAELLKERLSVDPVPVHESAHIAVALSILDELQLVDDVVRAFFEARRRRWPPMPG